jgi:hypothetical protein
MRGKDAKSGEDRDAWTGPCEHILQCCKDREPSVRKVAQSTYDERKGGIHVNVPI